MKILHRRPYEIQKCKLEKDFKTVVLFFFAASYKSENSWIFVFDMSAVKTGKLRSVEMNSNVTMNDDVTSIQVWNSGRSFQRNHQKVGEIFFEEEEENR